MGHKDYTKLIMMVPILASCALQHEANSKNTVVVTTYKSINESRILVSYDTLIDKKGLKFKSNFSFEEEMAYEFNSQEKELKIYVPTHEKPPKDIFSPLCYRGLTTLSFTYHPRMDLDRRQIYKREDKDPFEQLKFSRLQRCIDNLNFTTKKPNLKVDLAKMSAVVTNLTNRVIVYFEGEVSYFEPRFIELRLFEVKGPDLMEYLIKGDLQRQKEINRPDFKFFLNTFLYCFLSLLLIHIHSYRQGQRLVNFDNPLLGCTLIQLCNSATILAWGFKFSAFSGSSLIGNMVALILGSGYKYRLLQNSVKTLRRYQSTWSHLGLVFLITGSWVVAIMTNYELMEYTVVVMCLMVGVDLRCVKKGYVLSRKTKALDFWLLFVGYCFLAFYYVYFSVKAYWPMDGVELPKEFLSRMMTWNLVSLLGAFFVIILKFPRVKGSFTLWKIQREYSKAEKISSLKQQTKEVVLFSKAMRVTEGFEDRILDTDPDDHPSPNDYKMRFYPLMNYTMSCPDQFIHIKRDQRTRRSILTHIVNQKKKWSYYIEAKIKRWALISVNVWYDNNRWRKKSQSSAFKAKQFKLSISIRGK